MDMNRDAKLTHREKQLVVLICEDLSGKEIGHRLGITEATVEFHRAQIRRSWPFEERPESFVTRCEKV